MTVLIATIVLIFLLHYLITTWRRKKAEYLQLQATNLIEKRDRKKITPVIRELIKEVNHERRNRL